MTINTDNRQNLLQIRVIFLEIIRESYSEDLEDSSTEFLTQKEESNPFGFPVSSNSNFFIRTSPNHFHIRVTSTKNQFYLELNHKQVYRFILIIN